MMMGNSYEIEVLHLFYCKRFDIGYLSQKLWNLNGRRIGFFPDLSKIVIERNVWQNLMILDQRKQIIIKVIIIIIGPAL